MGTQRQETGGVEHRTFLPWRDVAILAVVLFVSAVAQASGPIATIQTASGDQVTLGDVGPIRCVYDGRLTCTRGDGASQDTGAAPSSSAIPRSALANGFALAGAAACRHTVTGTTSVTNLFGTAQQITLVFTLPIPPIGTSTVMGGSLSGSVTDANSDGVGGIGAPMGSAIYTALIDGAAVATLYPAPFFVPGSGFPGMFVPPGSSQPILATSFGLPGPTAPGPPVTTSIGIKIDFNVGGGDSVAVTSNFTVDCAPPTPTSTATATTTSTATVTKTPTLVPVGGSCTDTSDCATGLFCADAVCCTSPCDDDPLMRCDRPPNVGTCASPAAPAPSLSATGLLVALVLLLAVAGLALWRGAAARAVLPGRD